jgi:hypothetical protein
VASKSEGDIVGEWMAIALWQNCAELARPGIVFEVRNAHGQSLLTPCVQPLPAAPFDWISPATEFRAVPEKPPERSAPLPAPKG